MKPFAFAALIFLTMPASQMLRDAAEFHDDHRVRALLEQEIKAIDTGDETATEKAIRNFDDFTGQPPASSKTR